MPVVAEKGAMYRASRFSRWLPVWPISLPRYVTHKTTKGLFKFQATQHPL